MKLSVALCTYNGERYIHQQIDSILSQELPVDEITIIDDCSTDNTWNILNVYQSRYSQIKLFQNTKNIGYLKNFEKAINQCTGDIIFLSDQDDIWEPSKSKKIKPYFENTKIQCVISDLLLIDSDNHVLENSFLKKIQFNLPDLSATNDIITHLINFANFAPGAGMAIRKKKAHFEINVPFIHDGQLLIDSLKDDGCVLIQEVLTRYRIHSLQNIGINQINSNPNYEMNLAIERYRRALFIKKKYDHIQITDYKNKLKEEQNLYLQQFSAIGRIARRLKWFLFPPFK